MLNACVKAILCTCRHIQVKSGVGLNGCLHSTLPAAAAPWQRAERGGEEEEEEEEERGPKPTSSN